MELDLGNIFIRFHGAKSASPAEHKIMEVGEVIEAHGHHFDHVTCCRVGKILVQALTQDDVVYRERVLTAATLENPDDFYALIPAGVRHRLTALERSIYDCVYAHRNAQGDVVQKRTGWEKAYS
jgi:quercetin dioxygenase-like cupin family protein